MLKKIVGRRQTFNFLMGRNSMLKPSGRMFSEVVQAAPQTTEGEQVGSAMLTVKTENKSGKYVQSLWEWSENSAAEQEAKNADEAAYLANLKNAMTNRDAWQPMEMTENDTVYVKKLKAKINALVEKELAFVDFQDKVNKEELAADTFNEVITK
jgi:hypothetical protein